jgi:hypothetical protein
MTHPTPLFVTEFAGRALVYCAETGASVTSWIRTTRHNAVERGVPHSAHLIGLAVDVVYDEPVSEPDAQATARDLGLLLIREGDHDHLQPLTWRAG